MPKAGRQRTAAVINELVLDERKATVFLGPVASDRLTGQTLGARSGETGSAFFLEP